MRTPPSAVMYHATRIEFDALDPSATADGGLHFGTLAQARMRGGAQGRMIAVELKVSNPRRFRDTGGQWASKIKTARSAGHDAIVYLNRYEGVSLERILSAQEAGVDLDRLTDMAFRKWVPEAEDSWIVFRAAQVHVLPFSAPASERGEPPAPALSPAIPARKILRR